MPSFHISVSSSALLAVKGLLLQSLVFILLPISYFPLCLEFPLMLLQVVKLDHKQYCSILQYQMMVLVQLQYIDINFKFPCCVKGNYWTVAEQIFDSDQLKLLVVCFLVQLLK